jgi:AbiV family abortive infection protein
MNYVTGAIKAKDLNFGALKKLGYEDHKLKISKSFLGIYTLSHIILNHSSTREKFEKLELQLLEELSKWQAQEDDLNRLKNVSLYVTYSDNDFHLPDLAITLSQFVRIQKLARLSLETVESVINFIEAKGGFAKLRQVYLDEMGKSKDSSANIG